MGRLDNFFYPALVALIKQPVSLVDDKVSQVLQREPRGLLEVIQQPPRRRHDDVHLWGRCQADEST